MGKNDSSNAVKKIAVGASLAAVAGYLAGVLTAPKTGKQTRDDLKAGANRGFVDAERELKKLHTELADLIGEVKDRGDKLSGKTSKEVGDVVEKGRTAKEKARELLSALHEGDAEDQELKQAVKQASAAIDHLRKFLRK
jgi:gas vesicle protein